VTKTFEVGALRELMQATRQAPTYGMLKTEERHEKMSLEEIKLRGDCTFLQWMAMRHEGEQESCQAREEAIVYGNRRAASSEQRAATKSD